MLTTVTVLTVVSPTVVTSFEIAIPVAIGTPPAIEELFELIVAVQSCGISPELRYRLKEAHMSVDPTFHVSETFVTA
jgi:hypothetical protein